jgi:hypothetical protein
VAYKNFLICDECGEWKVRDGEGKLVCGAILKNPRAHIIAKRKKESSRWEQLPLFQEAR